MNVLHSHAAKDQASQKVKQESQLYSVFKSMVLYFIFSFYLTFAPVDYLMCKDK